ncbi:small ribosomal subunit protein mS23 [Oreochromis niloticus]|uniref:Small ribosomal subunit protein mS23 n=1 Tax=Oreochromis niloticus TaxID=8128 RepID=I3JGV1_ORENI|nr:28S ribosomal protein S23, mitochondrial [Oreochromis niloticus]XP_005465452.1 28S ribosomal protein S23, mitochondrial [Oreochromis niloticus]
MAGSRLERFGTVFTRVRDLIRSGVIKPKEKPLWYDVYKTFPPKRAPLHVKPVTSPSAKKQGIVPEIFYSEDKIRTGFYEQYGRGLRALDLSKSNFVSTCQRFVDKYRELKSHGMLDNSSLFEETAKALLKEGIILRRRGAPPVLAESRDPVLDLKLIDMLAEQQSAGTDTTKTTEDKNS